MKMGGGWIEDEWDLTAPFTGTRTIVLVGRTGNGKSATGNTIIGEEVFDSKLSSSGVTGTCELQIAVMADGHMVHVIDTPGLFDITLGRDRAVDEIAKCITMAKHGIHAVVLVLSVKTRFTEEEAATIRNLQYLFGSKIVDYMIVLFTGGDELNGRTLDHFLGPNLPQPLHQILSLCNGRKILFDNSTRDETKRAAQVEELMALVNAVVEENGGRPYTDDIFVEMQRRDAILFDKEREVDSVAAAAATTTSQELKDLKEEMMKSYEDQLKRITEMLEGKLRETTERLQEELAKEQAARLRAEEAAAGEIDELREELERSKRRLRAEEAAKEEIQRLRERLQERSRRETEELSIRFLVVFLFCLVLGFYVSLVQFSS